MFRLRHRAFPDQVLGDGPHQMLRSQLLTETLDKTYLTVKLY